MNDIANTETVAVQEGVFHDIDGNVVHVEGAGEAAPQEAPVEIFVTEDTANHVAL